MALTRSFKKTVMERAQRDRDFRIGLITEAMNCLLEGDIDVGKSLLRDYLNATGTFEKIAEGLNKKDKSIRRMLGPSGNPTLNNFIQILNACKKAEHIKLQVDAVTMLK